MNVNVNVIVKREGKGERKGSDVNVSVNVNVIVKKEGKGESEHEQPSTT